MSRASEIETQLIRASVEAPVASEAAAIMAEYQNPRRPNSASQSELIASFLELYALAGREALNSLDLKGKGKR